MTERKRAGLHLNRYVPQPAIWTVGAPWKEGDASSTSKPQATAEHGTISHGSSRHCPLGDAHGCWHHHPLTHPGRRGDQVLYFDCVQLNYHVTKIASCQNQKIRLLSPAPAIFSSSPPSPQRPLPSAQVTGERRSRTWWASRDHLVQAELFRGGAFPLISAVSSNHKDLVLRYIHWGTCARLCLNLDWRRVATDRARVVPTSECSSCVSVNRPGPWVAPGRGRFTPWAAGIIWLHFSSLPPPLLHPPAINHSLLRFCFFSFDGLRFDRSSSNRFGGYGGDRGWLFFYFVLTDTGSVGQCVRRFAGITVHFLGFASYLFALLLFREEPLRGLKNLCSLLCLQKQETTTEDTAALPKPVNHSWFQSFHQLSQRSPRWFLAQTKSTSLIFQLFMDSFLPISENVPCDLKKNIWKEQQHLPPPFQNLPSYKILR